LTALCAALPANSASAPQLHPWAVYELTLTAQKELSDAYRQSLPDVPGGINHSSAYAQVTFTGVGGAAQGRRCVVPAFWDGGRTWKARFAPPAAGRWTYATQAADSSLGATSGTLECTNWTEPEKQDNPLRRGFLRVASAGPRAGRYFTYADGTPLLWLGDTWWDWAKPGIKFESFKTLVDDRAAKGFTVGQLRFSSGAMLTGAATQINLEEIRRVERMIAYANSRGITVWIQAWWGGEALGKLGPEPVRRWWRYTVQRLAAYHVVWVLAGEYNMDNYGGLGLRFWEDLAATIRREDPFGHMVSAHPTPPSWERGMAAPQWSTADVPSLQPLFDFNQSQVGHGRWANEMIPSVVSAAYAHAPAKPIVVTEPWYEFVEGSAPAEDIRYGAWAAILSGAAGHSYGGGNVWWANVPEAPHRDQTWPHEPNFEKNTLDYPGARSLAVLARFLRGLDWWRLEPHPELISGAPSRLCAAVPGQEYLVYLRWGGLARVDLRPSTEKDRFEVTWVNPATGAQKKAEALPGGAVRAIFAPGGYPGKLEYQDWVLWLKRRP
jgi:hypothetical protein